MLSLLGNILLYSPLRESSSSTSNKTVQSSGNSLSKQLSAVKSTKSSFLLVFFFGFFSIVPTQFYSCANYSFLMFYGISPTRFIVSQMRLVFILRSNGDDEDNDGQMFTSISHGFNLLSINISKPYIS